MDTVTENTVSNQDVRFVTKFSVIHSERKEESFDTAGGVVRNETHNARLAVVTDGSEENKQFFKYTPSGTIELQSINGEAGRWFDVGQEYYVYFVKA